MFRLLPGIFDIVPLRKAQEKSTNLKIRHYRGTNGTLRVFVSYVIWKDGLGAQMAAKELEDFRPGHPSVFVVSTLHDLSVNRHSDSRKSCVVGVDEYGPLDRSNWDFLEI